MNDRNCADLDLEPEAQRFFDWHQPVDSHDVNGNGDGEAYVSHFLVDLDVVG